jgi:hypothetical protein
VWLLTPSRAAAAATEPDDDLADQFAGLGVRQQQIDAVLAGHDGGVDDAEDGCSLQLWAWHLDALRLFEALRTQWRKTWVDKLGCFIVDGLRYECLPVVCRPLGLNADDPQLFNQLRTMERAGARCLNQGEGVL